MTEVTGLQNIAQNLADEKHFDRKTAAVSPLREGWEESANIIIVCIY